MYFEGSDFESREFRRGVWHQTTTAVALLTCAWKDQVNVMACEWAMLVSISPFCFVVSVHATHVTYDLIEGSGEFGLSFCTEAQARLSHISGSYSLRDVDKWGLDKFPTLPGKTIAAPMIDGAAVNAECRVIGRHDLGHTVYIGETLWARYDPDTKPLLYHDGKYWRMGERVEKT